MKRTRAGGGEGFSLEEEFLQLHREFSDLKADHAALEGRPFNLGEHEKHRKRLHAHMESLRRHIRHVRDSRRLRRSAPDSPAVARRLSAPASKRETASRRAQTRAAKVRFDAAHVKGTGALQRGDLQAMGEAIIEEREAIQALSAPPRTPRPASKRPKTTARKRTRKR